MKTVQRAEEGKWESLRIRSIDKSGREEMASSFEKWRASQTARPGEWTSLLGGSQEEAWLGGSLQKAGQPRSPGKGY